MLKVRRPSPATLIALVALFVALGGTSYAVTKLPKNSVGTAQIKKNAVTSAKVKNGTLAAADLSKAAQASLRGQTGATGAAGAQGPAGPAGPSTPQTIGAGAIGAAQLADGSVTTAKLADGSVTTAKLADPPAWTTLTNTELGTNWSTNPANNPGQFFKGADDIVHFRGELTCTMPNCNDLLDTLPTAVRPERNVRTVLYVRNSSNSVSQLAPTELTSIGILGVDDFTFAGQVRVYLDNLSYRAAS